MENMILLVLILLILLHEVKLGIEKLKWRNKNVVLMVDEAKERMMKTVDYYFHFRSLVDKRKDDDDVEFEIELMGMGMWIQKNWIGDVDHKELDNLVVQDQKMMIDVMEVVGVV